MSEEDRTKELNVNDEYVKIEKISNDRYGISRKDKGELFYGDIQLQRF